MTLAVFLTNPNSLKINPPNLYEFGGPFARAKTVVRLHIEPIKEFGGLFYRAVTLYK